MKGFTDETGPLITRSRSECPLGTIRTINSPETLPSRLTHCSSQPVSPNYWHFSHISTSLRFLHRSLDLGLQRLSPRLPHALNSALLPLFSLTIRHTASHITLLPNALQWLSVYVIKSSSTTSHQGTSRFCASSTPSLVVHCPSLLTIPGNT